MDKSNQEHEPTSLSQADDHSHPVPSVSQLTSYTGSGDPSSVRSKADREFDRAYQRAFIQDVLSFLRYDSPDLLPFDTVSERLNLGEKTYLGVQTILLDQIVGSVGRYNDFTRTFLPRTNKVRTRWQSVDQFSSKRGIRPIQVYQVGKVYFVLDGNHRVSIARRLGAKTIEAHVWEFETRVPLEPDDTHRDLLIRQEYLEFLEHTQLDKNRPDQYIIPTSPGRYRQFEEQIAIHRHYMELECGCNIPFQEAAAHWYDQVYCPIVDVIHEKHMLRLFPGRTEADLVNWIIRNKDRLRQRYGAGDAPTEALAQEAADLAHTNLWRRFLSWIRRKVFRWPVYTGQPWQP
jgi:hypothetical protein